MLWVWAWTTRPRPQQGSRKYSTTYINTSNLHDNSTNTTITSTNTIGIDIIESDSPASPPQVQKENLQQQRKSQWPWLLFMEPTLVIWMAISGLFKTRNNS
jgi:hypothetical protein